MSAVPQGPSNALDLSLRLVRSQRWGAAYRASRVAPLEAASPVSSAAGDGIVVSFEFERRRHAMSPRARKM